MLPTIQIPTVSTGIFDFSTSTSMARVQKPGMPVLHDAQMTIKMDGSRFIVECCGRRFGKNVLSHDDCVDFALEGLPVAWGSPTYKNLADDWRTLSHTLAPITRSKSEQEHRIELVTGGTVEMWSLDSPEPIRGRKYGLFVINEAASVRQLLDIWNEIIRSTLIDLKGSARFPSTPKGKNDFYKLYSLGIDPDNKDWSSFHYTSYDNPYLDPEELDALKHTMTEEAYRQEILAEFIEGEGQVMRNIEASTSALPTTPDQHKGHTIVAGVDWGKQADFTAISIGCVNCRRELDLDRFNQIDYYFQRSRLMQVLDRWGVRHTIAELNAMGEPIVEQLQRDGVRVVGFKTTFVSKAPLIEELALAMERGEIQFLKNDNARLELEAFERSVTQTGMSKYSAPEGMHDDTVIARALMYRAMSTAPRPKPSPTRLPPEIRNLL